MKKLIILIICLVSYCSLMAQPRIRMRDIIGLNDSIAKKADKSDPRMSNSRQASDVAGWAKSPTKPSYTPQEVGAAPASHTQDISTVTGLQNALDLKLTKAQADTLYAPIDSTVLIGLTTDTTSLSNRIDQKVDLTDPRLTNPRPASDVSSWAKQPVKPTYTYSEVGAAAASHSQAQTTITGLRDTLLNRYTKAQADSKLAGKVNTNDARLSDARPASDVYPWAKTSVKPVYTYSEVGAAAASHTQGQSTITALPDSLRAKFTRTQSDNRYFRLSESEEASLYFYTKAQVDHKIDSIYNLLIAYIGANPPVETTTLGNGLISIWEFDEVSGTTATDAKSGYNATLYNGALVNQTGKVGKCLTMDGVNDYARVAQQVSAFDNLTGSYSISVWVKNISEPSTVNRGIVYKAGGADVTTWAQWGIVADPSGVIDGVNVRSVNDGFTPDYLYPELGKNLPVGEWHHLVVTYDATSHTQRFYFDGALSSSQTVTGTVAACTTSQLTFGSCGGANYLNCSIDQTAIWNREINLAEVQSIYNNGSGKAYTSW